MAYNQHILDGSQVKLIESNFMNWQTERCVTNYGAILLCREGNARILINFRSWNISPGSVITLFPNDVVRIENASPDLSIEGLFYTMDILREASIQIEPAVYYSLREDCCKTDLPMVTGLTDRMLGILAVYFAQPDCGCLEQLSLLQLKCYFLGYYDHLRRHPHKQPREMQLGQARANDIFDRFMHLIERDYKTSRDVSYYARMLAITPKHLTSVITTITGQPAKEIIDNYIVMQLKLILRNTNIPLKEIAWDYNFSSLSFFCRYFKRQTGITPMQYRNP